MDCLVKKLNDKSYNLWVEMSENYPYTSEKIEYLKFIQKINLFIGEYLKQVKNVGEESDFFNLLIKSKTYLLVKKAYDNVESFKEDPLKIPDFNLTLKKMLNDLDNGFKNLEKKL